MIDPLASRCTDAAHATSTPAASAVGDSAANPRGLPFATLLVLSEEEERALVEDALARIDDLKAAAGWTAGDNPRPDPKTWFGKREIAQKKFDGNLAFRAVPNRDGSPSIFQSSNVSLNIVKHQVRDLVASVVNDTCGTKPFFVATPVPEADGCEMRDAGCAMADRPGSPTPDAAASADPGLPSTASDPSHLFHHASRISHCASSAASTPPLSTLIERFADERIDASNCEQSLRQGLQTTCIKGEQVYKIAHRRDTSHTRERATILCDAAGRPLLTHDGDAICPGDELRHDSLGQLAPAKDPALIIPEGARFVETVFDRFNTAAGPDVSPVDFRSFLCPLNVDDIHKGTNVFLYDLPIEEAARLYRHPGFTAAHGRPPTGPEALALLRELENETAETSAPKTPISQPDLGHGEGASGPRDDRRRVMQIAEFYDKRDVDGDGFAEEFILVLDVRNRRALYYDYLDQVFPGGRRPFEVTTVGRVDFRWYGTGLFEQFERQESFIDTQLNRANYRNSAAGRIDGYDPAGTEETAAGEPMQFGVGIPYKLKPGRRLDDVFQSVQMPALTGDIVAMMERMIQSVRVEGGHPGAADGDLAGATRAPAQTAYGVRNREVMRDSLQGYHEDEMQAGVLAVVRAAVHCVFAHMEDVETFSYQERDRPVFATLTREQVRGLRFNVALSLLPKQTQQNLQNIQLAVTLGKDYLALPRALQKAMRPLYVQQLKILKVQEAESILADPDTLPEPSTPLPTPEQAAQLMTALASLIKAGAPVPPVDVSAVLGQAGLAAEAAARNPPGQPSLARVVPAPNIRPAAPAPPPMPVPIAGAGYN